MRYLTFQLHEINGRRKLPFARKRPRGTQTRNNHRYTIPCPEFRNGSRVMVSSGGEYEAPASNVRGDQSPTCTSTPWSTKYGCDSWYMVQMFELYLFENPEQFDNLLTVSSPLSTQTCHHNPSLSPTLSSYFKQPNSSPKQRKPLFQNGPAKPKNRRRNTCRTVTPPHPPSQVMNSTTPSAPSSPQLEN
jgi:hypothetical protein